MQMYFIWFLIGIIFLVYEGLVPSFFAIFFTASAWILSFLTFLFPSYLTFDNQLIFFGILAIVLTLSLRKYLNPYTDSDEQFDDNDKILSGRGNAISLEYEKNPQYAIITKEIISGNFGEIKFKGTFYKAKSSETLKKNQNVRVINQGDSQGTYFIVESD